MTEEAGKTYGIEKFDGIDFMCWRMQIEDYLYRRKLHLPILGTKPENMKAKEWALLDKQVLGVIRLTLSRCVAHNVVKEKTTSDLMKALSGMYENPSANNKEVMRMAVSNSTGKEKLKYNDIRDLIMAEKIRRRDAGETSGFGYALNLETRGRGHFRRQCKSPKKKNEDDSANAVIEEVQDTLLFAVDSPLDDWVLDLRALFHTTPHRKIIQNYAAGNFGKVYLADGSALDVMGLGDVQILLPNESVWLLEEVQHIPDLRSNLIYVGQLDDEGHAILFVGGTWKVTKGARVLARGKKIGTLYMTSCPRDTIAVADARNSDEEDHSWDTTIEWLAKRMNKTLNERARIPMEFRLPEEVWSGKEVMYKDRSTVMSNVIEIDQKKFEFVNLDELTESTVQKGGEEDKENVNSQVDLSTPVTEVRRSSRNIRPP
ncbi:Retrovirus-related Pol polyprotein from transposon TNT 1-94 [Vitis vinifera]|uniref:Retrovirus-related Pol polyprotein from transposon TNT 1-94 n=1 Tax=Vitis vinifera TaxID=29760 RepID=A0A438DL06_VITVI|nr:Retrovirus-related Pol polyprotein from transposon TNT 1-94 [Vitis vinifera]